MVEGLPSGDQHPVSKSRDVRLRLSPVSDRKAARAAMPPSAHMRGIMEWVSRSIDRSAPG